MRQQTHPHLFRVGYGQPWENWFLRSMDAPTYNSHRCLAVHSLGKFLPLMFQNAFFFKNRSFFFEVDQYFNRSSAEALRGYTLGMAVYRKYSRLARVGGRTGWDLFKSREVPWAHRRYYRYQNWDLYLTMMVGFVRSLDHEYMMDQGFIALADTYHYETPRKPYLKNFYVGSLRMLIIGTWFIVIFNFFINVRRGSLEANKRPSPISTEPKPVLGGQKCFKKKFGAYTKPFISSKESRRHLPPFL